MIYLLDTHTFIWTILSTNKLGKKSKEIIFDRNNEICISVISFWEISLKTKINKYSFENINIKDFPKFARNMDFTIVNMEEDEAISFHELPQKENHKYPFDRMLIWQAISKKMIMISKDDYFKQYREDGLKLIW